MGPTEVQLSGWQGLRAVYWWGSHSPLSRRASSPREALFWAVLPFRRIQACPRPSHPWETYTDPRTLAVGPLPRVDVFLPRGSRSPEGLCRMVISLASTAPCGAMTILAEYWSIFPVAAPRPSRVITHSQEAEVSGARFPHEVLDLHPCG